MSEPDADVLYGSADGVATITLNRPDKLNAWTRAMQLGVQSAVAAAAADSAVRVIVVTGAGRGFCAGADMNLLQNIGDSGSERVRRTEAQAEAPPTFPVFGPPLEARFSGRFSYLLNCPKPIIAAINGPAAGLGLVFALFADLRFAAASAKFTTSFAQRGLIAEHGISWLLPRLVGHARALDLLLSARKFDAAEAASMGLVNAVHPDAEFAGAVAAYAANLARNVSPRSMAVMKAQVWASLTQEFPQALAVADGEMLASFDRPDFREGVAHFVEKRAARFPGI